MSPRTRTVTAAEAQAVVDALTLMMRIRATVPYRGRGWFVLNGACCHLADRFWGELGMAAIAAPRPEYRRRP